MDADDLEPRKIAPTLKPLGPMSVTELENYIVELENEIARVRAAIASKRDVRAGAEALFRGGNT